MADVSDFIDVSDPAALEDAVARAREVLGDRGCVVLPTDTVYGIGADAFSPRAVAVLLAAKGRGRTMPPPVLISDRRVLAGLAYDVPDEAEALAERFWPGALTLILKSQPTLTWDLGETRGTVALRVPDDAVARELLYAVGPMAVSSANRTGMPAATTAEEARGMLGESVDLYLDAGPREDRAPSTIVDCTVTPFRVARQGAVLTHGHPTAWVAAAAYSLMIAALLRGAGLEDAVAHARVWVDSLDPAEGGETAAALASAVELAASPADDAGRPGTLPAALGEGWVAEEALAIAVHAALVAQARHEDPADMLALALRIGANHAGDSDSTASLAGQLLGAAHGAEDHPGVVGPAERRAGPDQ